MPHASRLSLIPSTFVLVFSANSDRRALVRRNLRWRFWSARACEAEWTAATPLFFSEPQIGKRIRPPTAHGQPLSSLFLSYPSSQTSKRIRPPTAHVVPLSIPPHPFSLFAIPIPHPSLCHQGPPILPPHLFKAPIFIREQIEISSPTWQHLFCNIIFTLNQ